MGDRGDCKRRLLKVIYDHNAYLTEMHADILKDIEYYVELIELNNKHQRDKFGVIEVLKRLNSQESLVKNIIDNFSENIDNEDLSLEEMKHDLFGEDEEEEEEE